MDVMNPIRPEHLTAAERLSEIGEILAAGFVRMRARQSSKLVEVPENCSLHSVVKESVCGPNREGEVA